eukprot:5265833-Amphidinium_carterae.1
MTRQFRMVAERLHRLQENLVSKLRHRLRTGPLHTVQQIAERELLPCYDQVNSALLVNPTYLDRTSGSTTTWPTSTRSRNDINMLSILKQQSHKRELPSVFEGNKQAEQQGPTTTM